MTSQKELRVRRWIATILTVIVVLAVWKYIDYRMRPPPPPNPVATPSP